MPFCSSPFQWAKQKNWLDGISWRKLMPRRAAPRQDLREIKFLRNGCAFWTNSEPFSRKILKRKFNDNSDRAPAFGMASGPPQGFIFRFAKCAGKQIAPAHPPVRGQGS